jgi:2-polyprenyl-3-methyl-5-hydroxy-6-metoxy-1,4-benzoquinol methylase
VGIFDREKKIIADAIRHKPVAAAMFEKNWNRYSAVVRYAIKNIPIDPSRTILDYGSGFPFVSKLLLLLGYQVCSYEPFASEAELEIAGCLQMESLYTTSIPAGEQFGYVFLVDVIEHLSVIKQTMTDVAARTASDGYLIVSTPNVMRIEMWLQFVFRQTGHPQPIGTFVRSDNNYSNHQREFTMQELNYTLSHYGFKPMCFDVVDTQPSLESLARYHSLLGKPTAGFPVRQRLKKVLYKLLIKTFPQSFSNNLLLIGQKQKE